MSQSSREAAEACTTALGDGEGEQAEGAEGTGPSASFSLRPVGQYVRRLRISLRGDRWKNPTWLDTGSRWVEGGGVRAVTPVLSAASHQRFCFMDQGRGQAFHTHAVQMVSERKPELSPTKDVCGFSLKQLS